MLEMSGRLSTLGPDLVWTVTMHMTDVRARVVVVTMTHKTVGKTRNIWSSRWIPLTLKLHIYISGVCSVLVYGSEA